MSRRLFSPPLALVAISLCVPYATARAQSPAPPASIVPAAPLVDVIPAGIDLLEQGDELRITRRDARETFGILERVSSTAMIVATENGSQEVPLDAVRRVRRRGDRLWDGLLIGAGVGAVLGAATFLPCDPHGSSLPCGDNFTTSRAGDTLVGAAIFGLLGLGADVIHRGWSTVYTKRSGSLHPVGPDAAVRPVVPQRTLPEGVIVQTNGTEAAAEAAARNLTPRD